MRPEFDVVCSIDDGSRAFLASLSPTAAATLFGAPQGWTGLRRSEQAARLKTVVCTSYMMVVSTGSGSGGGAGAGAGSAALRIDAIGSDSATTQVSLMLQQIGKVVNA